MTARILQYPRSGTGTRLTRIAAIAVAAAMTALGAIAIDLTTPDEPAQAAQSPATCGDAVSLKNGGFEAPTLTDDYVQLDQAQVPGWQTSARDHKIELWKSVFRSVAADSGNQFAELNATQPSMLYQDVATVPGQTLTWSLKHRGRSGTDVMRVRIGVPGGTLTQSGPNLSDGNAAWGTHTGTYTVPAGQTTTRFGFEAVSSAGNNSSYGNFLDDITFGTAPCLISTKNVDNLSRSGQTAEVGDVLKYTVTTTNEGGNAATNVVSTDPVDPKLKVVPGSLAITGGAGKGRLTDRPGDDRGEISGAKAAVRLGTGGSSTAGGTLAPGESTSYSFEARVTEDAADSTVSNTATVAFHDPTTDVDSASKTPTVETPVKPAADLSVTKRLTTSELVPGKPATYAIVVKNSGPQTATGVHVVDTLPGADQLKNVSYSPAADDCSVAAGKLECDLDDLAVGESHTITVTGQVPSDASPTDAITNTVAVSGDRTDPDTGNNTDSAQAQPAAKADVSIKKSFTPDAPVAGKQVTYTLVAKNAGPSDAADVRVADSLGSGAAFVSASSTRGSCAESRDGLVTCSIGALPAGASESVTIGVRLDADAEAAVQNTASVTSTTEDTDPANNTDTASYRPQTTADLAVKKTASVESATVGDRVDFSLTASNRGPSAARDAVLTDTVPDAFEITGLAGSASDDCRYSGQVVTCSWETLAADATRDVVVQTKVVDAKTVGPVTNTAAIVAPADDTDTGNNADSATVDLTQQADLSVKKTSGSAPVPGQPHTYTITVKNTGPSTAVAPIVTDALPAGFAYRDSSSGCTQDTGVVTCQLNDLESGASKRVTVTGVWDAGLSGRVSNTAAVDSATKDPVPENNSDTDTETLKAQPPQATQPPTPTESGSPSGPAAPSDPPDSAEPCPTAGGNTSPDNGGSDTGGSLPRTGGLIAPVGLIAGLLLVGATAVLLTVRRRRR